MPKSDNQYSPGSNLEARKAAPNLLKSGSDTYAKEEIMLPTGIVGMI